MLMYMTHIKNSPFRLPGSNMCGIAVIDCFGIAFRDPLVNGFVTLLDTRRGHQDYLQLSTRRYPIHHFNDTFSHWKDGEPNA